MIYGAGISKSLQMDLAKAGLTSLCLGTDDRFPVDSLIHIECLRPSR